MDSIFDTISSAVPSSGDLLSSLKQSADLPPRVVSHLRDVYGLLAVLCGAAAAGCYLSLAGLLNLGGWLLFFGTLGASLAFAAVNEEWQRRNLALGIAFLQGNGLGPLVRLAGIVGGEGMVFAALGATALIFISFTAATLLSNDRTGTSRWKLYAFGVLGSLGLLLPYLALFNMFLGWRLTYDLELYLGLAMFSLYVACDTQVIVAKASMGRFDVTKDALELFIDLAAVFARVLIVLLRKEEDRKRREEEKRRRRR
ncbi:inhibitor of apoptosis-promoting Bax1-domain-containing protein [Hyaloraphidium curvatum]|nr:inhibitor of apoptosis-promoting Bax1-domain-containing protein [Hyaloraphidium curvatum]